MRCKFKRFEKGLGNFEAASVEIDGCKFEECFKFDKYVNSYAYDNSIIKFNNLEKFSLKNSEFIACSQMYFKYKNVCYFEYSEKVSFIAFNNCTLKSFEISKTKLCKCTGYNRIFLGLPEKFQKQSYFSGCEITDYDDNKDYLANILYIGR